MFFYSNQDFQKSSFLLVHRTLDRTLSDLRRAETADRSEHFYSNADGQNIPSTDICSTIFFHVKNLIDLRPRSDTLIKVLTSLQGMDIGECTLYCSPPAARIGEHLFVK